MIDPIELGSEFFEGLMAIDTAIVERAAEERVIDLVEDSVAQVSDRRPREPMGVPRPLLALDVQRAAPTGQPGAQPWRSMLIAPLGAASFVTGRSSFGANG